MKKLFSLGLAVLLICTMALPASADGSAVITVEYTKPTGTYEMQIPDSQKITAGTECNIGNVSLSNTQNFNDSMLNVHVSSTKFIGDKTKAEYDAIIGGHVTTGDIKGSYSSELDLYFATSDGNGGLTNDYTVETYNDSDKVDYLTMLVNLADAESDTYKATVTFVGTVMPIPQN